MFISLMYVHFCTFREKFIKFTWNTSTFQQSWNCEGSSNNLCDSFFQEALRALWNAAFPEEELRGLISEQWKDMGWQGKDPSTDFRQIEFHLLYPSHIY